MSTRLLLLVTYSIIAAITYEAAAEDWRHVPLQGQPNFRDVGGYRTSGGKSVKRGVVFRSGRMPRLTDNDIAKVQQLGIQTVVNFLTPEEIKSSGKNRLPPGAREILHPIDSDGGLAVMVLEARKNGDFSKVPPDINPKIHRVLVGDASEQYAAALRDILRADAPIVYHCSHGIHRTGGMTAILLWALGVPWDTVREDYLLSNACRKEEVKTRLEYFRGLAAKNQRIAPEKVDMTNVNAFYILKGDYIDATRDEILKEYGSIEKYLTDGLGLTADEIQQLRSKLLE